MKAAFLLQISIPLLKGGSERSAKNATSITFKSAAGPLLVRRTHPNLHPLFSLRSRHWIITDGMVMKTSLPCAARSFSL